MTLAKRRSEQPVLIYPCDAIGDGSKTVTTAGVAEQLNSTSTPCKRVMIAAKAGNTNDVFVGGSTIADGRGKRLVPSEYIWIEIDNLNKIYVDVETSGEGVEYVYLV